MCNNVKMSRRRFIVSLIEQMMSAERKVGAHHVYNLTCMRLIENIG